MDRNFGMVMLLLLLMSQSAYQVNTGQTNVISDGTVTEFSLYNIHNGGVFTKRISIASASNLLFEIKDLPPYASFVIFQIHTYQFNVTLSYDKENVNRISNRSIFGSNIGLYLKKGQQEPMQVFLKSDNVRVVEALLVITMYNDKAPIPGGCNMEFNIEVAPHQNLVVRNAVVIVDAQPASLPTPNGIEPNCQKNPMRHEMYRMFLRQQDFRSENYFSAIQSMLTVEDIVKNGDKIPSSPYSSPLRRVYSAYAGVGSVYAVVSTYENYSSAYIPTFTYACSPVLYPDSCNMLSNVVAKLFAAGLFFVGFYTVFFTQNCLTVPVFFVGSIIGYTIAIATDDLPIELNMTIGLVVGILIVIVWMFLYYVACMPVGFVFFSLTVGLFFTSIIYFQSSDCLNVLGNGFAFWGLFSVIAMAIALITSCLCSASHKVSGALFGAYMMILPLDYYTGSSLKYIVINIIRRITVSEFSIAVVSPPVQAADIGFTVLWILLVICGVFKCWLIPCGVTNIYTRFIGHVPVYSDTVNLWSPHIGRVNVRYGTV